MFDQQKNMGAGFVHNDAVDLVHCFILSMGHEVVEKFFCFEAWPVTIANMLSRFFYPVIHLKNMEQGLAECDKALEAGADGVFFISHHGDDWLTVKTATYSKRQYPQSFVGINLLSSTPLVAHAEAAAYGLDAIWVDSLGTQEQELVQACTRQPIRVFAGVAFKYQPEETQPEATCARLASLGFVPCTSGTATGVAADQEKITRLAKASGNGLALASGVALDNVVAYLPYVTHYLVASSISEDTYTLDFEKTAALAGKIHGYTA